MYQDIGGLEKITNLEKNKLRYGSYYSFDGTINRYTSMIHEDEKEIKHTSKNKKIQYNDTIAYEKILEKQKQNKNYTISGVESLN